MCAMRRKCDQKKDRREGENKIKRNINGVLGSERVGRGNEYLNEKNALKFTWREACLVTNRLPH